ncbi:site-specific integrase [Paracraurococcus ruber]|nr:hypothetical protein [Paracraurococcus ruber]TDG29454.1 hypothetical protein E2C05_17770 [Paracraurococcus ruber]
MAGQPCAGRAPGDPRHPRRQRHAAAIGTAELRCLVAACSDGLASTCDGAPQPYALPRIPARRLALAGIKPAWLEQLSMHGLRPGFITEAKKGGARDEAIMQHSSHRGVRTRRSPVRQAKLLGESPAGLVGL